jgi:hypothetical protein
VLLQVVVRAARDPLELAPAHRELVLDVDAALGVERELVLPVLAEPEVLLPDPVLQVPAVARVDPLLVDLLVRARAAEVLDLHLLELARAEREVAGRDLVPERLADLCDAERQLLHVD